MLSSERDQVESKITNIISDFDPEYTCNFFPVKNPDGNLVGEMFSNTPFFDKINNDSYPEIYNYLRGKIILLIGSLGISARVFNTLDEAMDFARDLSSPMKIINGPPKGNVSCEEDMEKD